MTRVTRTAAVLVAVALFIGACGDDTNDVGTSLTLPPTTLPATTPTVPPATTTLPTLPPTTTTAPPEAACSGAAVEAGEIGGAEVLPQSVLAKAHLVMAAARACDYQALGELTGDTFTSSFGGSDDPVAYWRDLEASGEPVTAFIVEVLTLSHDLMEIADPDIYVWPAVAGDDATDADWDEARSLYTDEEIDQMRELGSGYLGWRLGIDAGGSWVFFVAGD